MKLSVVIKVALGFVALALATIGLVIPIWPTTPFVLLAVGCFSALPPLRRRMLKIVFVREYYESYTTGKGVRPKTLVASLLFLWGMLTLSALVISRGWMTLVLLVIGLAVTAHLAYLTRNRPGKKVPNEG